MAVGTPTAVSGDLVVTELRNLTPPSIGDGPRGRAAYRRPRDLVAGRRHGVLKWIADGAVVAGATGPSYTPTAGQVGSRIRVRVVAAKPGYADAARTSAATAPVAGGP